MVSAAQENAGYGDAQGREDSWEDDNSGDQDVPAESVDLGVGDVEPGLTPPRKFSMLWSSPSTLWLRASSPTSRRPIRSSAFISVMAFPLGEFPCLERDRQPYTPRFHRMVGCPQLFRRVGCRYRRLGPVSL